MNMMKKYLHIGIVLFQLTYVTAGEKQSKRTSDKTPKLRSELSSELSKSQPILIVSEKIKEQNRLSQSSPTYLQLSPSCLAYSPSGYYDMGNLGDNFSPCMYDSSR